MDMFDVGAAHVRAIVVGIDHYGYGPGWDLTGPGADALRMVSWLLDCEVPTANIDVFLSPESWDKPWVAAWLAQQKALEKGGVSRTAFKQRPATREEFVKLIDTGLQSPPCKALFFFWGGHGVVADDDGNNYLYTADANPDLPYCVCAQTLLPALKHDKFSKFAHQVFVIDSCANALDTANSSVQLAPASFVLKGRLDLAISQCCMFAASMGKRASNVTENGTGLFSSLLLERISPLASPNEDDFAAAFRALHGAGATNGLARQKPCIYLDAPGIMKVRNTIRPLSHEGVALIALIRKCRIPDATLISCYLQSLVDYSRNYIDDKLDRWVLDLEDAPARPGDYPSPLVEFAIRLARAHPASAGKLQEWIAGRPDHELREKLDRKLANEDRMNVRIATLFVELNGDRADRLVWWLDTPGEPGLNGAVNLDPSLPKRDELQRCLGPILVRVENAIRIRFQLRLGFIVPAELFLAGLESVTIPQGLLEVPLSSKYPVVFHWRQRMAPGLGIFDPEWEKTLSILEDRTGNSLSTPVLWVEHESKTGRDCYVKAVDELKRDARAVCLGIGHCHDIGSAKTLEMIKICLSIGVPCFFWLPRPQLPTAAAAARELVRASFARQPVSTAPVGIWSEGRGADEDSVIRKISAVWDLREALPLDEQMHTD
ncbi:caspase family protein [Massilia sp. DJPM01]|uniref:caspase family protein n=1 Tax=Massilia sp. DJPM01 TaxID=3024404 RepID=UPI00259DE45A|nr:caspase family protein [Massilia sp. DJPM01]MDM5177450.1 caspase family protein [Massilia sp. DJPM01]